jgi:hypothetical protein
MRVMVTKKEEAWAVPEYELLHYECLLKSAHKIGLSYYIILGGSNFERFTLRPDTASYILLAFLE